MKREILSLPEMKLLGITARTNNALEPLHIPTTIECYKREGIASKIPHIKHPGTTICAYVDYESDLTGDYTYFIGKEVESSDQHLGQHDAALQALAIPTQKYAKFTVGPGPVFETCINAWKQIWSMVDAELGGKRSYVADFEVYDERALDLSNAVFDIYVGLQDDARRS